MATTAFPMPTFIYGTAWKEENTRALTKKAVAAGFKAIDTANQKKHYREDFVGEALLELAKEGIERSSLFLQTKYTYQRGQDHRLPYNPSDDFKTQVRSSFANSLQNLHTHYVDSFLLHGPRQDNGLGVSDWEVWEAMEELYEAGQTKMIGVSNVGIHHMREFLKKARIKPMIVQNRCYAQLGWDKSVREFCLEHKIVYQGFSLLTANPHVLENPKLIEMSEGLKKTPAQIVFRFARHIGILPLTGTCDEKHMIEDLRSDTFDLSQNEIKLIFEISK